MTKKDYILITTVLHYFKRVDISSRNAVDVIDELINRLSNEFELENDKFDPVKFKMAIYSKAV